MNQQEHMLNFYKVIYSERNIQPMAAKILAEETEKNDHCNETVILCNGSTQITSFSKCRYECSKFCNDSSWTYGL